MKKLLSLIITFILFTALTSIAEPVIFNTYTKKVHKEHCASAKKCTKNCTKVERKDAYNQGGIPCKQCGG